MSETASNKMVVLRLGDVHLIEFTGTSLVDQVAIQSIGAEIEELVDKADHPKFVIDLAGLQYVSSAMIDVIISINKKIQSMNGELRLAAVSAPIMEAFKLTRLDKILSIYDDSDKAMHQF